MRRFRAGALSLLLAFTGQAVTDVRAGACTGFRPARQDTRGIPPGLARPVAALPGDFDGDGIQDLVVVNRYVDGSLQTGSVSVLRRNLAGDYTLASTQLAEGGATWAVAADLDKDGRVDAATVGPQGVGVFRGNGTGGFHPRTFIPLGLNPIHILSADMDKDGQLDLIVVQQYIGQPQGRVTVLKGDGSGGFQALNAHPVAQSPRGGVVGDFDKNGTLDVVTGSTIAGSVAFLPGLGNGEFGPAVFTSIGATAYYLATADFNADTGLDLVVTGQTVGKRLMALRGLGNGTFLVTAEFPDGADSRNPVICDFDRNGLLDVAVANAGASNVGLFMGLGNGGFAPPGIVGTDVGPAGAVAGDINFDGFCDVVTANEAGDSVSVLLGGALGNSLGAPTIPTGLGPLGAAAADFNGDGLMDLATVNRDDGTVWIFRGNGEGWMFLSQTLAAGDQPGAITAADFNLDGAPDLVVADQGLVSDTNADSVVVLMNDTTGGFFLNNTLPVGDLPVEVKTADFNGDGRPDIVVANSRGDKVTFYFAEPGNSFSNVKHIRVGEPQRSLAVEDYDGDQVPDVAVSLMNQNSLVVLITTASGWSRGATTTLPGSAAIDQIAVADLDGDLHPDLVAIAQPADPLAPGELTALLGTGGPDGDFLIPHPAQSTGIRPEAVAVLDLDGVGASDLVVANRFDNDIMVFTGDGTGRFTPGGRYGAGNDPFYLAVADFNNDGRQDVASVNFGGDSTSMLLNNAAINDPIQDAGFTSNVRIEWGEVPGAGAYNIYRDHLDFLGPINYGVCLAPALSNTWWNDPAVPSLGQGFFYLLTATVDGAEGPLGYDSQCLKRPNFSPCAP